MSVMQKLLRNANWKAFTGRLHVGIDTLAEPPILSLIDDVNYRVHERRRLPARREELVAQLKAAGSSIADIIVLARRGGYDLVDDLAEAGLSVYLLTPAELRRFDSIKNVHDTHDAYWIAYLLRSGALPQGEVYSRDGIRDATPYPRHDRPRRAPLAARLRLDQPRAVELPGKSRSFGSRR